MQLQTFYLRSTIGDKFIVDVPKLTSKKNDFEPLNSLVSLIELATILGLSKKKFSPMQLILQMKFLED